MNVITKNEIVGTPDFYPRVGFRNLFREGTVSASSESASGPKENAYDGFTYDFWRSAAGGEQYIAVQGVQSGTLQNGWNDRVQLSATASSVHNAYKGMKIRLTAGPSAGQERTIIAYNGESKIALVDSDWSAFDVNPSFMAELADLGSGEADLTLLLGTGSATHTRAGNTATTIDENGAIIAVLANVPRSYYDPTTLQYMGYLAEGARTNLVLNSKIDGTDFSTQSVTVTAEAHTLSFYGTGTITLSGASTSGPLVGTGAYPQRVSLTFTPSAASLTLTVTGSCKFVQLEVGSFASSFIPTAGSSVTRNADVLTYPSSGNVSATQGTAYVEISPLAGNTFSVFQHFLSLNNGTANESITINRYEDGIYEQVIDGGSLVVDLLAGSVASGSLGKVAATYLLNNFTATVNGGAVGTDTPGTIPDITGISVGSRVGANQFFGAIKNIRIYQTQFTAAQLQTLTGSSTYYPIPTDATEYEIIGYADYMAVAAHTLMGCNLTPQYSDDGATWTNLGDTYAALSNDPIAFEFDGVYAEYFRLLIEDAPDVVSIGAIHCGEMLTIERGLPVGWQPPSLNEDIRFTNTMSEGGQIIGRNIISRGASVQVRTGPATWGFSRGDWDDFIQVANLYACFFWWAYEDFGEVLYGGMTEQDASFSEVNFLQVSFSLEGIIK